MAYLQGKRGAVCPQRHRWFCFALLAATACTSPSRDETVSVTPLNVSKPACSVATISSTPRVFPFSRKVVVGVACPDPANAWTRFDDATTGQEVSFPSVLDFERAAKSGASKFDGRLAAEIDSMPESERVEVDVWFTYDAPPIVTPDERKSSLFGSKVRDSLIAGATDAIKGIQADGIHVELASQARLDRGEALEDGRLPFITLWSTKSEIRKLAKRPYVQAVMRSANSDADKGKPGSEAFYDVGNAPTYQNSWGFSGGNIVIANLHAGAGPDSTRNLPMVAGACVPSLGGPSFRCFCQSSPTGPEWHDRLVTGMMRNDFANMLRGGMANSASLISANYTQGGTGACSFTGSLLWAQAEGARVINHSYQYGTARVGQDSFEKFVDFLIDQSPWPTVTFIAGNFGAATTVGGILHNGLVVGGAYDQGLTARASVTQIYSGSSSINPTGSPNWELPHLVAPAQDVDTVGAADNIRNTDTGTSLAAPQVAGVAAAIKAANSSALASWPYAVNSILLVGPEKTVGGEPFPESFSANISHPDRRTGVGLLNGSRSLEAALVRRQPNGTAAVYAHDRGFLGSSPASHGPWKVKVPNGATLRAASWISTPASCTAPLNSDNCTAGAIPYYYLHLWDPQGSQSLQNSWNSSQGYQYLGWTNNTGALKTLDIYINTVSVLPFNGSEFGLAWQSL